MSVASYEASCPLDGAPSLVELARALLDALGLRVELPAESALTAGARVERAAGVARVTLGGEAYVVDPYAGGVSSEAWLAVEGPGCSLRASIQEVAWVGPELAVAARGPAEWVGAVRAVVEAFVDRHGR